jgi:hypothetical protein
MMQTDRHFPQYILSEMLHLHQTTACTQLSRLQYNAHEVPHRNDYPLHQQQQHPRKNAQRLCCWKITSHCFFIFQSISILLTIHYSLFIASFLICRITAVALYACWKTHTHTHFVIRHGKSTKLAILRFILIKIMLRKKKACLQFGHNSWQFHSSHFNPRLVCLNESVFLPPPQSKCCQV